MEESQKATVGSNWPMSFELQLLGTEKRLQNATVIKSKWPIELMLSTCSSTIRMLALGFNHWI